MMQLFLKKSAKKKMRAGRRKLLEVMNKFMSLIMVMVSWAYTFLQINQVMYIKFLQYFVCQSYPNKAVKKESCSGACCAVQRFQNVFEMCLNFTGCSGLLTYFEFFL